MFYDIGISVDSWNSPEIIKKVPLKKFFWIYKKDKINFKKEIKRN